MQLPCDMQQYGTFLKNAPIIEKNQGEGFELFWGKARVYADHPEKVLVPVNDQKTHLATQLKPLLEQAGSEVIMFSPYFVPGRVGVDFLLKLVVKGVSVTVITNSLASTDVSIVHAGYRRYRKELLKGGVRLIEMKPILNDRNRKVTGSRQASLHTKTYIIDRQLLFVGSLNLDPRSTLLNTELGIVYKSKAVSSHSNEIRYS